MGINLHHSTLFFRLLADPTRLRLLILLESEELTVAELANVTRLAQPRVSTHLAKLKESKLVIARRAGVSTFYRFNMNLELERLSMWNQLSGVTHDPLINEDLARLPNILNARSSGKNWADSVAGDMERHYSPGRTWEATARAAVHLLKLGHVIDIASGDGVISELLAPQAQSITCVDLSKTVIAAAEKRLFNYTNTSFHCADMHQLPFSDQQFDTAILMHALTYTQSPDVVLTEASRILRSSSGKLLGVTLKSHPYENLVEPFNHLNRGFDVEQLSQLLTASGFKVNFIDVSSREQKSPYFEVITFLAEKY